MSQDEVETLRSLSAHREVMDRLIEEHGGRIANTAGDSVLAEFPSAVDAVQCAIEVQKALADLNIGVEPNQALRFRIGIHVGDVMVRGSDLLGDGVNIAARLEGLAEPGGVCISGDAYRQVRQALATSFRDLGPQRVKNIEEPIAVYAIGPVREEAASRVDHARTVKPPQPTDKPAIAVLPLVNLSEQAEHDYFADGLTEDIIAALSYWRWFPVIARNSVFAYKGKSKTATDIGQELGASYLVEGSVRRAGERVRISIKLVEASTGHQLWAERYDREILDIFDLQDEITERVVASLEPELHRAEQNRIARKPPDSLDAWDLALRALSLQHRMSRQGHAEARELLNKALEIDPRFYPAWSRLALCCYHEAILGWAEDRDASFVASLEAADRAVELEDRDWLAHGLRGMAYLWTRRDFDAALSAEEYAVSLNPSAPLARHFLACILEFIGRPAEAIPHLQVIHRLDPRYQFSSLAVADEALCCLLTGDLDAALTLAEKAVRMLPANVRARQRLCAALVLLGREDDARAAMADLLRAQPGLSLAYVDATYPFKNTDDRQRFTGALLRAGLPE
jgi:adenylate cyclase